MNTLKEDLRNTIVQLEYNTVKGEVKEMNCTLNKSLFDYEPKIGPGSGVRRSWPEGVQVVWDIDSNGFRSFRTENVISWSTTDTL